MRKPLGEIRIPRAFLYDPLLSKTSKVLYLYLHDIAGDADFILFSRIEAATQLHLSTRTIRRSLSQLVHEQYITDNTQDGEETISFLYDAKS